MAKPWLEGRNRFALQQTKQLLRCRWLLTNFNLAVFIMLGIGNTGLIMYFDVILIFIKEDIKLADVARYLACVYLFLLYHFQLRLMLTQMRIIALEFYCFSALIARY